MRKLIKYSFSLLLILGTLKSASATLTPVDASLSAWQNQDIEGTPTPSEFMSSPPIPLGPHHRDPAMVTPDPTTKPYPE